MQTYQPSNFGRSDTLLGICQSIGDDVGFNPNYLRISLATMVFFNLGAAVAVYLALGAVVLATRLLHRAPRKLMPQTDAAEAAQADAPVAAAAQNDAEFVPMAAAA
jgi:phage shock protein C